MAIRTTPRYNVGPTSDVWIVRKSLNAPSRDILAVRWGLLPPWTKDIKTSMPLFNARADTVAEKPSFRTAFKRRRCLVPVDHERWLDPAATDLQKLLVPCPADDLICYRLDTVVNNARNEGPQCMVPLNSA